MKRFLPALLSLVVVLLPSREGWGAPECPGSYDKGTWNNCVGTYTWSPENTYIGAWKDGKKHGQGTVTYTDGTKYVGEFRNDKFNGRGTLTYASGKVLIGMWENNKLKTDRN